MEIVAPFAMPSLLAARPVRVWVVLFAFILYVSFCFALLFGTVAPVADFPFQPNIEADSSTYWAFAEVKPDTEVSGSAKAAAGGNTKSFLLIGPVLEAYLLRTDLNAMLFNCALFLSCLWILHRTPEFDRSTFLLLVMINPFLISALTTLNKEIFALAGAVYFVAYANAKRYRIPLLLAALALSWMARWQQLAVLMLYLVYESRWSPLRGRRRLGVALTILGFGIAYAVINQLFPYYFAALLTQADAGRTIVILDAIQAKFGFPLVVIPKIMMDCLGHLITPLYFLTGFWYQPMDNWHDQFFLNLHCFLITALLLIFLFTGKLQLRRAGNYVLVLYLIMTAVSPMVQPRYEYPVYVLLCLEASRYWRFQNRGATLASLPQQAT